MSKSFAKHTSAPYRSTPLDNMRWSAVMTVLFLTGLLLLGFVLMVFWPR